MDTPLALGWTPDGDREQTTPGRTQADTTHSRGVIGRSISKTLATTTTRLALTPGGQRSISGEAVLRNTKKIAT